MPRALSIYLPRWPTWWAKRRKRVKPPKPDEADRHKERRGLSPPSSECERDRRDKPGGSYEKPAALLLWNANHGVQRVACCCEIAAAAGVREGMTLAHAHSLLIGLSVEEQPYEPQEDTAGLLRLARWMLRWAPIVALDAPDGLMLDIVGCERLFGGPERHAATIASALRGLGLSPRIAVAPTFACAWAVARYGSDAVAFVRAGQAAKALAPLPVAALRIDADIVRAMADVGIRRVEHVLAIPRKDLAARYGLDLLRRLDQATGCAVEHIEPVQTPPRFEARREFDGPVQRFDAITLATRELLETLLADLRQAGLGACELELELRRVGAPPEVLSLTLTYPNREISHIWALLGPKLEQVHLGFGVEEITLRAARSGRWSAGQTAFLREASRESSDHASALGQLVDRLADRLGSDAVTRVDAVEAYVPEAAFVHHACGTGILPMKRRAGSPCHADRPSRLFDVPEPVRVVSLVPDGPPGWLEWRGISAVVVASAGPERIAFPWWTPRPSAGRDYFEIEDERGRRLWVYRDGGSGEWFVHGEWA